MNNKELVSRFIRIKRGIDQIKIFVCSISWPHPHEPESSWSVAAVLPSSSSSEDILSTVKEILRNKQYFQVCQDCGQRNPCGWMHDDKICQSCAEQEYDTFY